MLKAFIRTVFMYAVLMIGMRLMGKRQIGQLEPNELAVMILISELAALPMQDDELPLHHGVLPIATLVVLEIGMSLISMKSIRLRGLFGGRPSVLIHNGKLIRKEIKKSRVTIDEVVEELRIKGVVDLSTVQYAVMETNGQLSVILYPEHQPATAGQIGVQEESKGLPLIVMNDGRWMDKNLRKRGITREYVLKEMQRRGAVDLDEIYVVILDELNHIYIAGKEAR